MKKQRKSMKQRELQLQTTEIAEKRSGFVGHSGEAKRVPRVLFAVECRSAGCQFWATVATERKERDARLAMRAIRRLMPEAHHRGTLQVTRYLRHRTGAWIRDAAVADPSSVHGKAVAS